MCARYGLHSPLDRLQEAFGFTEEIRHVPRWNIAPMTEVLVVRRRDDGTNEPLLVRWGLESRSGAPIVNARSESAAERPLFRDALQHGRVLMPADGFFEWKQEGDRKQPFWIQVDDGRPFALAALYEPPRAPGEPGSVVVLTTDANAAMAGIHERMPVIVPADRQADWLDGAFDDLLRPYPAERTRTRRVDPKVNSVKAEGPDLLDAPRQRTLF